MTAHPLLTDGLGRHGPVAVALALAVGTTGTLAATDPELAELLGCSVRTLQSARTALAADAVLSYKRGRKGRPTEYTAARQCACHADHPGPKPKRERKPQDTDPLFDAICWLVGETVKFSAPGRVAKLAHQMLKAGLTAERLKDEIFLVAATYAGWRDINTLDLDSLTKYWPYILTPPQRAAGKGDQKQAAEPFSRMYSAYQTAGGNPLA